MRNLIKNCKCQVCSSSNVELAYNAPLMPLGAQLLSEGDEFKPEMFYPLHYMICCDCSTFQSVESVPEDLLRSENTYVSATSKSVIKRDRNIYEEIRKLYKYEKDSLIVEIGGSDGVFLEEFLNDNMKVVNVEPVGDVAEIAIEKGIDTIVDFYTKDVAAKILEKNGKADLVIAKHVLELVPDLNDFLSNIVKILSENGRVMMEVPYVKDLIEGNFYDSLAHLRKYHFSLTSLKSLFAEHGLHIEEVVHYSDLGGGFRFYAGWKDKVSVSEGVKELLVQEKELGMDRAEFYIKNFKKGVKLRRDLFKVVDDIVEQGKKIVGYGAGIKASALLNSCKLDERYIEYLVDNGKHKQGRLMPGVRLPIYSPDKIDDEVDYILMLAWLHQDEIVESLKAFLDRGGKIIIPTPKVEIID